MVTILGIPFIAILVILQSSVVSRLNVSYGQADLVLVFLIAWALQDNTKQSIWWAIAAAILISFSSALPMYIYLLAYIGITIIALAARKKLWKVPLVTQMVICFIGTLLLQMISYGYVYFTQTSLPFYESLIQIILPSAAMNMVLGIPVFIIVKDLASIVYPRQEYD